MISIPTPYNSPMIPAHSLSPNNSPDLNSAILSDRQIKDEMKDKNIVIEPYVPSRLGNCSYNITLGPYYYTTTDEKGFHNPWKEEDSKKLWIGPHKAEKEIIIPPGHMVLAHTNEFIGGKNHITTMMKSRSSMGRNFVDITCGSAGFGDVQYISRWTMEIINHHPTLSLVLPVGKEVGQIIFFYTGNVEKIYQGKYQQSDDLEELKSSWNPSMMLPRLYTENKD